MNKSKFLILFLIFSTNILGGQIKKIKVLDEESQNPIINVNIYNERTESGSTTDLQGKFNLNELLKDIDTLKFSHIGYKTKKISIGEIKSNHLIVLLTKTTSQLDLIDIESKKLKDKIAFYQLEDIPEAIYAFSTSVLDQNLYVIAGNKSKETKQALKILDRNSHRELDDFIKDLRSNPNMDWENYSSEIFKFNFITRDWNKLKSTIIPRAFHNSEVLDNRILIFGGKTLSANRRKEFLPNKIEIYDWKTDSILIDETNPHMAINFASFRKDSLLFILGGSIKRFKNSNRKEYTNKVHAFNSSSGLWKELSPMPEEKETSGVLVGNIFYFIGGYNERPLKTIETFNLSNGKWNRIGELFEPMERPGITQKNDIIYIYDYKQVLTLDTTNYELKQYSIDINLIRSKMVNYDDQLYIIGGYKTSDYEINPSKKFYRIPIESFSNTLVKKQKVLGSN